jgi:hypothetical protein
MQFGDNGFDHIYHHHNMKCAGTTINRFLDLQVPHILCQQPITRSAEESALEISKRQGQMHDHLIMQDHIFRHHFDYYRVLHDHAVLTPFAKGKTYVFTVMRNAQSRLVSYVSFCRKMSALYAKQNIQPRNLHYRDATDASLAGFLTLHRRHAVVDNYLVRSIASLTISEAKMKDADASMLLSYATRNLAHHADRIMLTESLDRGVEGLCEDLGLCPQETVGVMNTTKTRSDKKISAAAQELVDSCTRYDQVLVDYAIELVQHAERGRVPYTRDVFEKKFVRQRLATLVPLPNESGIHYDLDGPLVGYGFWGRDAGGTPHTSTWSGPNAACGLYLPVPKGDRIRIVLEIGGFAGPEITGFSKVEVDDRPRPFNHRVVDNVHYVEIDVIPARDFAHVRLELPTTVTLGSDDESRACGFLLRRYGWMPREFRITPVSNSNDQFATKRLTDPAGLPPIDPTGLSSLSTGWHEPTSAAAIPN